MVNNRHFFATNTIAILLFSSTYSSAQMVHKCLWRRRRKRRRKAGREGNERGKKCVTSHQGVKYGTHICGNEFFLCTDVNLQPNKCQFKQPVWFLSSSDNRIPSQLKGWGLICSIIHTHTSYSRSIIYSIIQPLLQMPTFLRPSFAKGTDNNWKE